MFIFPKLKITSLPRLHILLLSFHDHSLSFFSYLLLLLSLSFVLSFCDPQLNNTARPQRAKMALQAPSLHCIPTVNGGLRRPSVNPFALKSSFFAGSLNLHLHPNHRHLTSAPPRISMRVASKQAYICRDCGSAFIFFSFPRFQYNTERYAMIDINFVVV